MQGTHFYRTASHLLSFYVFFVAFRLPVKRVKRTVNTVSHFFPHGGTFTEIHFFAVLLSVSFFHWLARVGEGDENP